MKEPLALRFGSIADPADGQRHIVRVRFAEALQKQGALDGGDDESLHAFRLACKRLRFAIERLEPQPPNLKRAAELLSVLTDELGWAHDCAELAQLAQDEDAPLVSARARRDRSRFALRARRLWRHAFRATGEFASLARYAAFQWSDS